MSDIVSLFNDFITMAEERAGSIGIWREQPVDLLTFFEKKLKERPYPGKQTELLESLNQIIWWKLTEDGNSCSEDLREVTEAITLFGKGSGKDFLISGFVAWIAYILCCMADPQGHLKFGQDEPIDIVNVAVNSNQANEVFFKKLKARLRNCSWFREVKRPPTMANEFQVTRNKIRFYKNITCHSAHSESEAYEGFNPLVVVFDEYGGYTQENAVKCYKIFKSSASTRYNNNYLLAYISYPRSEHCPMSTKYNEAIKESSPTMWAIKGKTWEVNLNVSRETFKKDYEEDPESAAMYYECLPPKHSEGLFRYPERIAEVTQFGKHAQCTGMLVEEVIITRTLKSGEEKHYIGNQIHNLELDPRFTYYLGGDCGITGDTYVLDLMHGEPVEIEAVEGGERVSKWVNKPVEDLMIEWRPNKKERLPVDLLNVGDIIEQICSMVYVKKALFDKFNSAETTQRLVDLGVDAEDKAFSNPFQVKIYQSLKSQIYTGNIELLDYKPTLRDVATPNEELAALKLVNGNKIDHDDKIGDKKTGKDYSDARAAAAWICSTDEPDSIDHFAMPSILGARRKV